MDLLNGLIIYWSDENITNNLKNHIDINKTNIYFRFFFFNNNSYYRDLNILSINLIYFLKRIYLIIEEELKLLNLIQKF